MRVLLYSRAFAPAVGGVERFAEVLCEWLSKNGHEVWLATATPGPVSADARRPYRVLRGLPTSTFTAAVRWADIVHVNGLALRGIVPARLVGRPTVVTHAGHQAICATGLAWSSTGSCSAGPVPGPCEFCPRRGVTGRLTVALHRLGAQAAARNVCISRYLQRRLTPPNPVVLYNPVVAQRFMPANVAEVDGLIAFAGRFVHEKGLDVLLRAMTSLPDARLEVGGDGPMRGAWETMAEQLELGGRVRFLGRLVLNEVAALYARATVVCVPSVWDEPFGYAAAEAMAAGKAVVATPRGALPELLGEGRGFLASASTADALARALRTALDDQAGRAQAGTLARAFAQCEFDIDRIATRYVATYEEAAA